MIKKYYFLNKYCKNINQGAIYRFYELPCGCKEEIAPSCNDIENYMEIERINDNYHVIHTRCLNSWLEKIKLIIKE